MSDIRLEMILALEHALRYAQHRSDCPEAGTPDDSHNHNECPCGYRTVRDRSNGLIAAMREIFARESM